MRRIDAADRNAAAVLFVLVQWGQETEPVNYITVVRSPREHFLSHYYYYLQPTNKVGFHPFRVLVGPRPARAILAAL